MRADFPLRGGAGQVALTQSATDGHSPHHTYHSPCICAYRVRRDAPGMRAPTKLGRRSARALRHEGSLALHGGVLWRARLALGRVPAEHGVPAAAAPGAEELRAGAALGLVDRARWAAELAEAAGVLVRRHVFLRLLSVNTRRVHMGRGVSQRLR